MPVTVVIPVYNEVGVIGRVLAEMSSGLVDRVLDTRLGRGWARGSLAL